MIRNTTCQDTAATAITLPPQPQPYRLLAFSGLYTAVAGAIAGAMLSLRIRYGGVCTVARVPLTTTLFDAVSVTQTYVTWSKDTQHHFDGVGLTRWCVGPVPDLIITPQMVVSVEVDGSTAGDTLTETAFLWDDESIPRHG